MDASVGMNYLIHCRGIRNVLLLIMQYLDYFSLIKFRLTCRTLRDMPRDFFTDVPCYVWWANIYSRNRLSCVSSSSTTFDVEPPLKRSKSVVTSLTSFLPTESQLSACMSKKRFFPMNKDFLRKLHGYYKGEENMFLNEYKFPDTERCFLCGLVMKGNVYNMFVSTHFNKYFEYTRNVLDRVLDKDYVKALYFHVCPLCFSSKGQLEVLKHSLSKPLGDENSKAFLKILERRKPK